MLTIDANFRLKLKDRGLQSDPPLGDGWGHIVMSEPYKMYTDKYGYQVEVRHPHCAVSILLTNLSISSPLSVIQSFALLTIPPQERLRPSKQVELPASCVVVTAW